MNCFMPSELCDLKNEEGLNINVSHNVMFEGGNACSMHVTNKYFQVDEYHKQ